MYHVANLCSKISILTNKCTRYYGVSSHMFRFRSAIFMKPTKTTGTWPTPIQALITLTVAIKILQHYICRIHEVDKQETTILCRATWRSARYVTSPNTIHFTRCNWARSIWITYFEADVILHVSDEIQAAASLYLKSLQYYIAVVSQHGEFVCQKSCIL
jgi:hypothetical protein